MKYSYGAYVPLFEDTKHEILLLIAEGSRGMAHSIERIEKDKGHLAVRCPETGRFITVFGETYELDWLDNELEERGYYKFKR